MDLSPAMLTTVFRDHAKEEPRTPGGECGAGVVLRFLGARPA